MSDDAARAALAAIGILTVAAYLWSLGLFN